MPDSEWHWRFKLLYAEMSLWNRETSKAESLLEKPLPPSFSGLAPRFHMLQAFVLRNKAKSSEAEALLTRAAAEAEKSGDYELEADTELLLGATFYRHDLDQGEAAFRRALETSRRHKLEYQHSSALGDLGLVQMKREHFGNAIPYLQDAIRRADRVGAKGIKSIAEGNLADCYFDSGDLPRALEMQRRVVASREKAGLRSTLSDSYFDLGRFYSAQGDPGHAIEYLQKALATSNRTDAPVRFALIANRLAGALELAGALDKAEAYNQQALGACDRSDKITYASLILTQGAFAEQRDSHQRAIELYNQAAALAPSTPSVLWEAFSGLAHVYATTGDYEQAQQNFERALDIIDRSRASQLRSDYKITFLSALIHFYQQYVAMLLSRNAVERALEVADSSRASVLTEDLMGRSQRSQESLIRDVQRLARESDSTVLFYWLAPKQSYLWAIGPRSVHGFTLPDERQIADQVASYRHLIEEEKRDPLKDYGAVGARLYRTLIGPASAETALTGRIIIVPDGALHGLNFETLIVEKPKPHYWLEDVTISVAPSLGILKTEVRDSTRNRSLLLFGNPILQGTGFAPLPQATLEIQQIERHFLRAKISTFTDRRASPGSYRQAEPKKFGYLHFATHAEANESSPLDSAIVLSPSQAGYRLFARNVAEVPLTADLVTLSACRGLGTRTLAGEGVVGFAWAFFQAGARNVVTSLWDVNDKSTAQLMDTFYSGLDSDSLAEALRRSKLQLMRSGFSKPYFWAPFQLYSRVVPVAASTERFKGRSTAFDAREKSIPLP